MLWLNGKKIDAAFRRLRERRIAAGISTTAESPEKEAERIKRDVQAAQATGDIATIIKLIAQTSEKTTADFIRETCGSLLFLYYSYVDNLHIRPVDMDDLVDGLLYLDAKNYVVKKQMANTGKD